MDDLVSTQWLSQHLTQPGLVVLDCTVYLPGDGRDAREEFERQHVPGARFLDLDAVVDQDHPAPHMLPSTARFEQALRLLGVNQDDRLVVYDNSPLRSAARGWFMLVHFGLERTGVLDGGLGKWLVEGRRVESGTGTGQPGQVSIGTSRRDVVTKERLLREGGLQVVDARGAARFEGREPEPRPGVDPGHVPGARNLAYPELYNPDGTFKALEALRAGFRAANVDPDSPFVASCGSGITACSLVFAAHLLGNDAVALYDGSWSEWGSDPATPKAVGPA